MKTKLLSIAMMVALILAAITRGQAQEYDGPCLPPTHGLDDHQSAFCGSTETQTIALSAGVNWFSTYVEIALDDLKAALVDALDTNASITIKSKSQNVKYQRGRWTGQLASLDLAKMYLIDVSSDCEITLEGMPIDPSTLTLTISEGANYMAFPYSQSMPVANLFGTFPANLDQVKSKTQNTKYNHGRWTGSLNTLEPGKGYIYVSEDANDRVFTFPTNTK